MADANWKSECRPCTVDGMNAIWHRWVEVRQCIPAGLTAINDHPGGFVCDTVALVEFEGGEVKKVKASTVRFLGNERLFESLIFHNQGD